MWWRPWRRRFLWRRPMMMGPVFYRRPLFFGPALVIGLMFVLLFGCLFGLTLLRAVVR